jgi:hypothetical protein
VQAALLELAARARAAGQGQAFVAAVKELDRLLHLYPQFGEPLTDLALEAGQVWNGTVPPLVVRYAIYEERRLVVVGREPVLLPNSGI